MDNSLHSEIIVTLRLILNRNTALITRNDLRQTSFSELFAILHLPSVNKKLRVQDYMNDKEQGRKIRLASVVYVYQQSLRYVSTMDR